MEDQLYALTTIFTEVYYWITVVFMFLIHVGFCMYEVGASRRKNMMHTLMKNTMVIPLVTVTFFYFGWYIYFGWINENLPDPTSRLILVARAFMGMSTPKASEVTLTAMVWDCAGIESHDQRSRVLKKIDQRCEGYWVERRDGRTAVLHKGKNPNENTPG